MIELRDFRAGDEASLRRVFESAIHDVAIRDYSQAEVDAWAPHQFDPSQWACRVQGIAPFVVERDGEIVAYADVQPNDYIDHFFVAAAANGLGRHRLRAGHDRTLANGGFAAT